MSIEPLLSLVYRSREEWEEHARRAFSTALQGRYPRVADLVTPKNEERRFQLRVNAVVKEGAAPFAGLIAPDQDSSGAYGGMSLVLFPAETPDEPALVTMVIGSTGLSPDEAILGRPGHARKCAAIASWLHSMVPGSAWAKHDPVRVDLPMPRAVAGTLSPWRASLERNHRVLYCVFRPPATRSASGDATTSRALVAFLDLFFSERGMEPKKECQAEHQEIRDAWTQRLLPDTTDREVAALLRDRRYVIVEGPPGTGKTELARRLLREQYVGRGRVIQFHPGTTYESFIGGLAPEEGGSLGFTFRPRAGHLMEAAREAARHPDEPHLLVIDEINRADLAKVLGEAIHLFEPGCGDRTVTLAHDFPDHGRDLRLPPNLHVLGTMNSADRSIAILDVAVRRRFAFVPLWPQPEVVDRLAGDIMRRHFHDLLHLFIEHASEDALSLMPGHAYFLADDRDAPMRLRTGLKPLLAEYLVQGYVAGFADEVRAFLDRLDATE